ncbi:MAG: hypothetical protein WCN95_14815 [bacterium]
MFRTIFIASVTLVLLCCVNWWRRSTGPAGRSSGGVGRFPGLERLMALAMWVSFAVLATTGFAGASLRGHVLSGFWMLMHMSFAALFAGSLSILLIMRAEAYSFADVIQAGRFSRGQKICFWIIAACGAFLILCALGAMFPVLGTRWQHLAIKAHRYCALIALLAGIVYMCITMKRKV